MTDPMRPGSRFRGASLLAATLLAAAAFFSVYQLRNPSGAALLSISSHTLPLATSLLLAVLSGLLLLNAIAASRRNNPEPTAPGTEKDPVSIWRLFALLAGSIAFIAALPWLGYLAASALLVGAAALLFGNRRPLVILAMMVLAPLAISLFFEKAMVIYLPAGRLFE